MTLDAFSPTNPARVKCLVLPVGRIKQSQFAKFERRLQREHVIRLGDVSPDGRPERSKLDHYLVMVSYIDSKLQLCSRRSPSLMA